MSKWGNRKPSFGTPIDWSHTLADGIFVDWIMAENAGLSIYDSVRKVNLTVNFAASFPTCGWTLGPAMFFNESTGGTSYAKATTPAILKLNWPITLIWQGAILTTGGGAIVFGASYSNTQTSPYHSYNINCGANGDVGVGCNLGGTNTFFNNVDSFFAGRISVGPTHQLAARWAPFGFSNTMSFFADGVLMATMNPTLSNPIYNTDSQFGFGSIDNGNNTHPHQSAILGRVYNRALTDNEIQWAFVEPYAHYAPPRQFLRAFPMFAPPIVGPVSGTLVPHL